ncbi:MAG: translation initiation factor IF-2 subunit gamma [Theionarchaea archaeon]|nr:translation initiation factor IF-2 subunit gamma [Theionarchaea archaeon]
MIGHVDHGKTTLTKTLSGIWTDTHSEELRRGITIRLGYADTTFRMCPQCPPPQCYTVEKTCSNCGKATKVLRRVSFVDAPGHETLMATMLSGAAIMDGAVLVIAANEPCPQPQTKEHLMGLEICEIKNVVIVQNKIELISREEVIENYNQIKRFTKGTIAENAPIVPVSAMHAVNIDLLIQAIEKYIPTPQRDLEKPPRMYIARSFDVNRPGTAPEDLVGGVIGGSLLRGQLKVGDEIEIKPGIAREVLEADVASLHAGTAEIDVATPGGLMAVGTRLDPSLTKSDSLSGSVVGAPGMLPPLWKKLTLNVHLLERAIGTKEEVEITEIKRGETLMLNIGTAKTIGEVSKPGDEIEMELKLPICADPGERAAISRRIGARWRLIGYGIIQ